MDLRVEFEVFGGREEDANEEGSSVVRRSQRHKGQKPVNCSRG